MKKSNKIIALILVLCVLTGCKIGKLTYQEFQDKLGSDYEFLELPIDTSLQDNIENMAYGNNYDFLIFYYDLKTEADAKEVYTTYKDSENTECIIKDLSKFNYSKYTSRCDDKYNVVVKHKDVVISVSADLEYKDEVNAAIKKLGY